MTSSVSDGFNALRNRLALTDKQKETANARSAALSSFLSTKFVLAKSPILVGSYARNTIVSPERDIDLLVPFSYPAYKSRPAGDDSRALLYMTRDALNERYSTTKVSSQQIAVKLNFTDITVDVVPAFPRSGGGYLVADGSRGWQATNPPLHTSFITAANSSQDGMLKIVVRLMKYWNIVNGKHLSSLHVELLVAKMWNSASMTGQAVSALMAKTLHAMPDHVEFSCSDPWTENVLKIDSSLSSNERRTAINLLKQDAKNAELAESYRLQGNIAAAYERWDVVFGRDFPSHQ